MTKANHTTRQETNKQNNKGKETRKNHTIRQGDTEKEGRRIILLDKEIRKRKEKEPYH